MTHPKTAEMEAEIEVQRDYLAETVDQLAHKLDVKAQARKRAAVIKGRTTTDDGRPRPALVVALTGTLGMLGLLIWWRRR